MRRRGEGQHTKSHTALVDKMPLSIIFMSSTCVVAIAEISTYAAYADFSERLPKCGFTEDVGEGVPICWMASEEHVVRYLLCLQQAFSLC
jgi:hypothetical protein